MGIVSSSMLKELRFRTSLGIVECKKALVKAQGDIELAIENLRKESGLKAAKKTGRTVAEGVVATRVAGDHSYGILVEVNTETDFAARSKNFLHFTDMVAEKIFLEKKIDVALLMSGELEEAREALVQKIGENIDVRRIAILEGNVVNAYIHSNNRIAVLVRVTKNDEFAKDVAMHIAALNPQVVSPEDMSDELVEKERKIIKAQTDMAGKPDGIIKKMVEGRVKKFLKENSLLEQTFVKNSELTVEQLAKQVDSEVESFVRFEVGEGVEIKKVDFASEVAAQVKASQ